MACLVEGVQRYGAVVGVHHRLDGVAQVVRAAVDAPVAGVVAARRHLRLDALGVGVGVGGGVAVADEHDAAADHRDVGVAVPLQERRGLLEAAADVAVEDDPRPWLEVARDQQVDVAEAERERGPAQRPADRDPAAPVVAERHLRRAAWRGRVRLRLAGVGDDVGGTAGRRLAVVDARLPDRDGRAGCRLVEAAHHQQRPP